MGKGKGREEEGRGKVEREWGGKREDPQCLKCVDAMHG